MTSLEAAAALNSSIGTDLGNGIKTIVPYVLGLFGALLLLGWALRKVKSHITGYDTLGGPDSPVRFLRGKKGNML